MTHRSHSSLQQALIVAAVFGGLLLAGCTLTGTMWDQPRYDPLQPSSLFPDGSSARPLVEGSVPYNAEGSPNDPALTGLDESGQPFQGFPAEVNADLLALGQERYTIFCTPCHGPAGEGNGRVTQYGFEAPPSLLADNARALTNGELFQIITAGRGKMFPYGYRVNPDERWAVIAFVRALQLKNGAVNAADLTPADLQQIGGTQ